MFEKLLTEDVIRKKLIELVQAKYGKEQPGTLAYALEYVDSLTVHPPGYWAKSPRGWLGLGWITCLGRPHWLDHTIDNEIDTLYRQLRNVGGEEHDFSVDDPEASEKPTGKSYPYPKQPKICARCGQQEWLGNKYLCRGKPSEKRRVG